MAHVVTEKCNGCKFTDCVEVCPVHAIYADADVPAEYTKDIEFNTVESNKIKDSGGAAITVRKDALPGANDRKKALGY